MTRFVMPASIRSFSLAFGAMLLVTLNGCSSTGETNEPYDKEAVSNLQQQLILEGDQLLQQGEYETALMQYTEAARFGDQISLWMRIGHVSGRLQQPAKAIDAYQRVLALDSDYTPALEAQGEIYLGNRKPELAATAFQQAIALDDNLWRSHNGLGVVADLEGDYEKARAHYERALAMESGSPSLWTNYGYSHYLSGDLAKAGSFFEKALAIDSGYKPAWANLGLLAARSKDYARALDLLTRIRPDHVAYNDVGYIALLGEDLDQAEHLLKRATELSPAYYEEAHENLKKVRLARDRSALSRLSPNATASQTTPAGTPDKQNSRSATVNSAPIITTATQKPVQPKALDSSVGAIPTAEDDRRVEAAQIAVVGAAPSHPGLPVNDPQAISTDVSESTLGGQTPQAQPAPSTPAKATRAYLVKRGDTLSAIAEVELGSVRRWREIVALNPRLEEAGRLRSGLTIRLPGGERPVSADDEQGVAPVAVDPSKESANAKPVASTLTHKVAEGESLWGIALQTLGDGDRWPEIVAYNPGLEADRLRLGQVLKIPAVAKATDTSAGSKQQTDSASSHEEAEPVATAEVKR